MMLHGLSGTALFGQSGTGSSDYREPKSALNLHNCRSFSPLNLANKESFGFLLTQRALWTDGDVPPSRPRDAALGGGPQLTDVTLVWREGKREDWLKFGKPVAERIIDRRQRIEYYAAGEVFGLERWATN